MGRSDYFAKGLWNTICDQCGWKYKSNQLVKQWDNLMVCRTCLEKRNPQDFVRGVPDAHLLPYSRPESTDTFVDTSKRPDPNDYQQ